MKSQVRLMIRIMWDPLLYVSVESCALKRRACPRRRRAGSAAEPGPARPHRHADARFPDCPGLLEPGGMAALARGAGQRRRSANIEEKRRARSDEPTSRGCGSACPCPKIHGFLRRTRPSQAERNTVDPVRGARRQSAVKRAIGAAAQPGAPGCRSSAAARRRSSSSIKIRIRGPTALNCLSVAALAATMDAIRGVRAVMRRKITFCSARSQIEGPMMGEGRGVETVRVWVNVVTKVAIARPRRRRVALVVRRRVLGGCPRPMLLPTAAAAGAAARGRGACAGSSERAQCQPPRRTVASRAPRRAKRCPLRQLSDKLSDKRLPRTCARGICEELLLHDAHDRATSDEGDTTPGRYGGLKLESRVKTDRAGSRASPAPGLRRSHVGPRRAAE